MEEKRDIQVILDLEVGEEFEEHASYFQLRREATEECQYLALVFVFGQYQIRPKTQVLLGLVNAADLSVGPE